MANMFVACWGYDQTQYSIYKEVSRKGQFVVVEGYNSWACLYEGDLYDGSQVKIIPVIPSFYEAPEATRKMYVKKYNFVESYADDFDNYEAMRRHVSREMEEQAEVRTIVKVKHETRNGYRQWVWVLDNGEVVSKWEQGQKFYVQIVKALTRRKIRKEEGGGESIRIDSSIRAYRDDKYAEHCEGYAEQNEYTAYHGR